MAVRELGIDCKVAVIGAGLLGLRIAGELALQGCTVHLHDHDPLSVQTTHSIIGAHLQELRDTNLLPPYHPIKGMVLADGLLSSAVAEADIVFEAVNEDISVKNSLFKDIASVCPPHTLLCTSTLTLPMEDIFHGVPHPKRTLGVRFLFPVYLIDTVEISVWGKTAESASENVRDFLRTVRKRVFTRQFGEYPRKLSEEEALEKQKQCFHHTRHIS